jgi:hypothetical protein
MSMPSTSGTSVVPVRPGGSTGWPKSSSGGATVVVGAEPTDASNSGVGGTPSSADPMNRDQIWAG